MYHKMRWTPQKIKARLDLIAPLVYLRQQSLPPFRYRELDGPLACPPVDLDVDDSAWMEINPSDYWGFWMTDFILRTWFTVPADWDASRPIALYLPLGEAGDFSHPEALAYLDGLPYAACDRHHQEILLRPDCADGQQHLLALHGWTGLGGLARGDFFTRLYMRQCLLVQIHQPTRDFISLARVALETAQVLDENNPARHGLLNALHQAFLILETRPPLGQPFYDSLAPAHAALQAGVKQAGVPLEAVIHATGHAHLDVAWLWTLGEARRKAERTFYNVIRYMEQFPHYHFSQSQPQLYEYIRQDQPQLFELIKQRVAEGRWEPLGGMWVEADCNLSGAESLARQFLLGRTFFRQQFGPAAETPVLWLPDVFGYAWSLPQLIRQAGLQFFMTIKIGWSQYNRPPYDTFLWQGLDGTRVLTHFSTVKELGSSFASTYNSLANPPESLGAWHNFQQKELQRDLLMAYGYGDGGGGPSREMLENLELMEAFPGLPQVRHSSVRQFFEAIASLNGSPMLPVWNGELYLEYHRGTYTSQARNKRLNRKSEFLLHDAEFLAAWAFLLDPDYAYPAEEFTRAWRTVCLNQFHDILPGSSIGPVYEESRAQYAQLAADVSALRDRALEAISRSVEGDILLVNPTSFRQSGLVFIPGSPFQQPVRDGQPVPVQPAGSGLWADVGELPPYGIVALNLAVESPSPEGRRVEAEAQPSATSAHVLENEILKVEFNLDGDITRIYDKSAHREVLPEGEVANQFQAFEDRPLDFDAWDIDIYYDDKIWYADPAASLRLVESGPLRQTLEVRRKILSSEYTQRISLCRNSARLDFETVIHWNERQTLLKVAFPVQVLAPQATYEVQWGSVQRPTHRNTSWDWARFETCAHKWVDLSEGGYGVSLLNDCKYGHDIRDHVIRLTLLRSPNIPDPSADFGEHHFTYSLLPHTGGWDERTQAEAYALNDPLIVYRPQRSLSAGEGQPAAARPLPESFIQVDQAHVIVETVKRAEDGDGFIVRLYESQRRRGTVTVQAGFELESAWVVNLLEGNETRLRPEGNRVILDIKPFQIVTMRLKGK
ncbi:MAG TPA: alpha-mannosidase [Anaerolineales bacterium]|nr:alpha-mannosidase [Anaerolineales bacterium]